MKESSSFRLNVGVKRLLQELSDVSGKNKTEIVEYSIKAYHKAFFDSFSPVNTKETVLQEKNSEKKVAESNLKGVD